MGWSIKTNNENKWELYSSVSESVIASFDNQKDLISFIATEQIYEGKKKAIESLMTFPEGWTVNDERCLLENRIELLDKHFEWVKSLCKFKTYEEYYQAIDDKLKELMK